MSSTFYRGYHIRFAPTPLPIRSFDWSFYHDDFDGAEDSNDHRCGCSSSLEAAKADIDDQIADAEIEQE